MSYFYPAFNHAKDRQSFHKCGIADREQLFRKGIISLLRPSNVFDVTIEAGSSIALLNMMKRSKALPLICIIDIGMPDGHEAIKEIRRLYPLVGILVLTSIQSDFTIHNAIKLGAGGYLLKSSAPAELNKALKAIYRSGRYYSAIASKELYERIANGEMDVPHLRGRQAEFLKCLAESSGYGEVAGRMGIGIRTVESYRDIVQKVRRLQ